MPNAELQDELVWVLQPRQYRDGRSQRRNRKARKPLLQLTKFSDLQVGKIAGCARRGWINNASKT
jgi:hypothetical protein